MATTTTADVKLSALPPATGQAGLRGVLASEFTKLRSVRSTYWTIGALLVLSVGLAAAIGAGASSDLHNNPGDKLGFDATQTSLGFFFYGVALVISVVTSFLAFLVGQAVMSGTGVSASLTHSVTIPIAGRVSPGAVTATNSVVVTPGHVLTAIIGTALLVTVAAVIAFGLGAIIRHTAGAIASAIGLLFVVPIIIQLLPSTWRFDIMRFVPCAAGEVLSATVGDHPHLWSAWPQFGVAVVWAAVLVGVGAYLFRKRDA
jgi:ABC-2 type transport system permease protein